MVVVVVEWFIKIGGDVVVLIDDSVVVDDDDEDVIWELTFCCWAAYVVVGVVVEKRELYVGSVSVNWLILCWRISVGNDDDVDGCCCSFLLNVVVVEEVVAAVAGMLIPMCVQFKSLEMVVVGGGVDSLFSRNVVVVDRIGC